MLIEQEIEVLKRQWEQKKYFTDSELCDLFHVSAQTTARWRKMKKIGYVKTPTGLIRYTKKHVEEFERRFESPATVN